MGQIFHVMVPLIAQFLRKYLQSPFFSLLEILKEIFLIRKSFTKKILIHYLYRHRKKKVVKKLRYELKIENGGKGGFLYERKTTFLK